MMKRTKSVGTSTSSITPKSTSSPTVTMSSVSKIEISKTDARPVGFFPSYTSNLSATNTNDPPPYPVDSGAHGQDPPPYPVDRSYLPLYQLGPVDPVEKSLSPQHETTESSAPMIIEIDNKVLGLTPSEREEIIDSLLQMKGTVDGSTSAEMKDFSNAQRKLKELLLAAQSKLTQEDKDEFINEAKKIKEIKNNKDLKRLEDERNQRCKEAERRGKRNKEEVKECYCDLWSIKFKVIQLVIGISIYVVTKRNKILSNDDLISTHLLILLCFVTAMFTSCLLIFYSFGRRPSRSMFLYETAYYILCIFAFGAASFFQYARSTHIMFLCIGIISCCAFDLIRVMCYLEWNSNTETSEHAIEPKLKKDILHLSEKDNCYDSKTNYPIGHCDSSKNVFVNEIMIVATSELLDNANFQNDTGLNLDFLDDDYLERVINLQSHDDDNKGLVFDKLIKIKRI